MNWTQGGVVIVRLPPDKDGKIIELVGDIQSIDLEMNRDVQPIYSPGNSVPISMSSGSPRTTFTIRGVAREQKIIDPPEEKVIRPSRWSDIMEEDF